MVKRSWKWLDAYDEARKKYGVAESKKIANKTIKHRKKKKKPLFSLFE